MAGSTSHEKLGVEIRSYTRHLIGCTDTPDSSTSNAPERSSRIFPIAPRPDGQTASLGTTLSKDLLGEQKESGVSQATVFVSQG